MVGTEYGPSIVLIAPCVCAMLPALTCYRVAYVDNPPAHALFRTSLIFTEFEKITVKMNSPCRKFTKTKSYELLQRSLFLFCPKKKIVILWDCEKRVGRENGELGLDV